MLRCRLFVHIRMMLYNSLGCHINKGNSKNESMVNREHCVKLTVIYVRFGNPIQRFAVQMKYVAFFIRSQWEGERERGDGRMLRSCELKSKIVHCFVYPYRGQHKTKAFASFIWNSSRSTAMVPIDLIRFIWFVFILIDFSYAIQCFILNSNLSILKLHFNFTLTHKLLKVCAVSFLLLNRNRNVFSTWHISKAISNQRRQQKKNTWKESRKCRLEVTDHKEHTMRIVNSDGNKNVCFQFVSFRFQF